MGKFRPLVTKIVFCITVSQPAENLQEWQKCTVKQALLIKYLFQDKHGIDTNSHLGDLLSFIA